MTPTTSTHTQDTQTLGDTITRMDDMAQSSFQDVMSMAQEALAGLEASGGTQTHPEALAGVLRAIWGRAEQAANDINCEAEQVGRNYVCVH